MTKRAVIAGCNYPGTNDELQGCVNDACNMRQVLIDVFGFEEGNIVFMIDTDTGALQPTGQNVRQSLARCIQESEEGDVLVFFFSGHGGPVPAESGDPEDNGEDEAIYGTDSNFLTDDDFRTLLKDLRSGVAFTYVSDSCYSGGMLDTAELQVGLGEEGYEGDETEPSEQELAARDAEAVNKVLSPDRLLQRLSDASGHEVKLGTIRATAYELFGDYASSTVKVFVKNMINRLEQPEEEWANLYGEVGVSALEFLKRTWDNEEIDNDEYFDSARHVSGPLNFSGHANAKPETETLAPETGILISACQFDQLSQDVHTEPARGAFTSSLLTVVVQYEGRVTNKMLVNEVRRTMVRENRDQRPCLYCSEDKVDANFICEVE
ncbi:hypothetical protein Mapa_003687 [Marchantia paleacea]|nr:hypothetical protein Mapa_003687 [Marchantia paleacea]